MGDSLHEAEMSHPSVGQARSAYQRLEHMPSCFSILPVPKSPALRIAVILSIRIRVVRYIMNDNWFWFKRISHSTGNLWEKFAPVILLI